LSDFFQSPSYLGALSDFFQSPWLCQTSFSHHSLLTSSANIKDVELSETILTSISKSLLKVKDVLEVDTYIKLLAPRKVPLGPKRGVKDGRGLRGLIH
jgi:hypothetical protein